MDLPDFSEMIKQTGETTKSKMNKVLDDMKTNVGQPGHFAHSMEIGEELSGDFQEKVH